MTRSGIKNVTVLALGSREQFSDEKSKVRSVLVDEGYWLAKSN